MNKVSVIIPFYNSYKYMDNCIKSLENQTYKCFEAIFVNDCSTDNSAELLQNRLEKSSMEYKIINNNSNLGPGASRNNGIINSSGQYISFMDSDDWYSDVYLEKMMEMVIKNECDLVMCSYNRIYENLQSKKIDVISAIKDSSSKKWILANSFDSLCSMLIKRELFDNIYIPEISNGEDMAIIPVIISKSTNIGLVDLFLYNYLYRENSLSSTINIKICDSLDKSFKYIRENIDNIYKEEIEFLGIKIIIYSSVLIACKNNLSKNDICKIIDRFGEEYDDWISNKYIKGLSTAKRIFVANAFKKRVIVLKILALVHKVLFRLKIA